MKSYTKNPWLVENVDDFNFWCCPECAYKSKDRTVFKSHAVENHPKSTVLFDKTNEETSKNGAEILKEVQVNTIPTKQHAQMPLYAVMCLTHFGVRIRIV